MNFANRNELNKIKKKKKNTQQSDRYIDIDGWLNRERKTERR